MTDRAAGRNVSEMRAMVLSKRGGPLLLTNRPRPQPGPGELLIRVSYCGVCRTDLHILDGELEGGTRPVIPGHQVTGVVEDLGPGTERHKPGDRVGVPWLGRTCRRCSQCANGRENLCDAAVFTGFDRDGGFAEFVVADEQFVLALPRDFSDLAAAPLLCAGLIGFRTLRMAPDTRRLGIYGFGAAAHIVCQIARFEGSEVYAFVREGDTKGMAFARELGVTWSGPSSAAPPDLLDAALIFAPAGELVPLALRAVRKGGTVVCGGIHMSDIPSFPYRDLWGERVVRSVANLTRKDGEEFLALAPRVPIHTKTTVYPLESAGEALDDLRHGRFEGAAVLRI